MKKLIIASMALAMLFGCKKGENDPGISLRSRDARIVGEWKMSSFEKESKTVDKTYVTPASLTTTSRVTTTKYDGSKIVATTINNSITTVASDTANYEFNLKIEKDGTCIYTEKRSKSNVDRTYTSKGTWFWVNSKRNKSSVMFTFTDISAGANFSSGTYQIDELKNKEMVLIDVNSDNDETTSKTGTSTENTHNDKYTFKQ